MNWRIIALAACLFSTTAGAQTTVDLSLADARAIAMQALLAGDTALAQQIALGILAQVPDDRAALVVVAAAAPQLGDASAGRRAGARAFAVSQTDIDKYEAARLTALAAANEQRLTLATWWLRRALIVAQTADQRSQTLADARLLQQQNPWSFDLAASLAPSSNVNGGATGDIAAAPGNPTGTLSDDAQALAGWRGSLTVGARYRLHQSANSRTVAGARYQANRTRIADDVDLPDATLSTDSLTLHLRHDRALETGSIGAQLSYAMVDYRDLDALTLQAELQEFDIWRLGVDRRLPLGPQTELGLSAQRSLTRYDLARIGSVDRYSAGVSLAHRQVDDTVIRASVDYGTSAADNRNYVVTDWTVQIGYFPAAALGPITLGLTAGANWADYPRYSLLLPVAGGRQDTTVFGTVDIGFSNVSYAGFTPALTITASATDSNVTRFTRETLSAGLTIRSEF